MQAAPTHSEADLLLELEEGEVRYGDEPALRGVDLRLRSGELHVLLGPSGSGKTTLLRAVAGFEALHRGTLRLRGEVVDGPKGRKGRTHISPEKRRIGFVFQDYALFPHLDVLGNVAFGRMQADREGISERLRRAGLDGLEARYPSELSGGQQQRVALVRALAMQPGLVCLDEPFSNVDRGLRRTLRREMRRLLKGAGVSSLLVTHDADDAFALADRISVLADGRLLQTGTPQEVYEAPKTLRVAETLGDVDVLAIEEELGRGDARTSLGRVAVEGEEGTHLVLRPEQLRVLRGEGAEVLEVRPQGGLAQVAVVLPDGRRVTARTRWDERPEKGPCAVTVRGPLRRVIVDRTLACGSEGPHSGDR